MFIGYSEHMKNHNRFCPNSFKRRIHVSFCSLFSFKEREIETLSQSQMSRAGISKGSVHGMSIAE